MRTRTKQVVTIGGVLAALSAAGLGPEAYRQSMKLLSFEPKEFVRLNAFDDYTDSHQHWGEEVIKRIDGRLSNIDNNVERVLRRQDEMMNVLTRRADAGPGDTYCWETW